MDAYREMVSADAKAKVEQIPALIEGHLAFIREAFTKSQADVRTELSSSPADHLTTEDVHPGWKAGGGRTATRKGLQSPRSLVKSVGCGDGQQTAVGFGMVATTSR